MTRMRHSSTRAALIHQHMTRDRAIADRMGAAVRQALQRDDPATEASQ
ncbi:integrase [Kitasatospora sp. NPDC092039]